MIRLSNPTIRREADYCLVSWTVDHPRLPQTLWAKIVNFSETPDGLSAGAWAALTLLMPAMSLGEDLEIEGEMSPILLFNMNRDLQSLLTVKVEGLKKIAVRASEPMSLAAPNPNRPAATGFSGGVDSFYTLQTYFNDSVPQSHRVGLITTFNVGAMGPVDEARPLFERYSSRLKEFAGKYGLDWVTIDTNVDDFFAATGLSFNSTHNLRNNGVAYLLSSKVQTYLYSSSVGYEDIGRKNDDISYQDPMLLPLISTTELKVVSAGAGASRLQKTLAVADNPMAYSYLDVCIGNTERRSTGTRPNCSTCVKCARAIMTFEALGVVDRFASVFDLEEFAQFRKRAQKRMKKRAKRDYPSDRDTYHFLQSLNEKKSPPSIFSRLLTRKKAFR